MEESFPRLAGGQQEVLSKTPLHPDTGPCRDRACERHLPTGPQTSTLSVSGGCCGFILVSSGQHRAV